MGGVAFPVGREARGSPCGLVKVAVLGEKKADHPLFQERCCSTQPS